MGEEMIILMKGLLFKESEVVMGKHLNPSEAVYGFAGWLTGRKEKTVMSSGDDAAVVADRVALFCEVNNLPDVSEDWANNLIHPSGEVAVPGIGINK